MDLLYKRGKLVFQFLRYVIFIGICIQDYNFQMKRTEFTPCVLTFLGWKGLYMDPPHLIADMSYVIYH